MSGRRRAAELDYLITPRVVVVGVKRTGRGRRKLGQKKRRMRARIRHRKK
jgi:hypothetical protein